VRRRYFPSTLVVALDIPISQIIGIDDEDVWAFRVLRIKGARKDSEGNQTMESKHEAYAFHDLK
jgi:hypothetical protein